MKLSEKYYNAACLISDDKKCFACPAIGRLGNKRRKLYALYFNPHNGCTIWFGHPDYIKNQHDRFMSLLLMVEIAKDLED